MSINKNYKPSPKEQLSVEHIFNDLIKGKVRALSEAITLIESKRNEDHANAIDLINKCLPHSGNSVRIGITGVPGVGKSTFIEALGEYIIQFTGKKVAVLAIDPSSKVSKGSILGDKTRMQKLSANEKAFIRPSASAGSLGGVANATRESILLCEAAGYEVILIETVGVGQSETEVAEMVDFFLLLMLAGAGDELQGIKRGIMEMADAIFINKAEGDNLNNSEKAAALYRSAIHLFPPKENLWLPMVDTCSAIESKNIDKVWSVVDKFYRSTTNSGMFTQLRAKQNEYWFIKNTELLIQQKIFTNGQLLKLHEELKKKVKLGEISPLVASVEFVNKVF